jgi:hypothetical protein
MARVWRPSKYPARCDAVLHRTPDQPLTDPGEGNVENPKNVEY